MVDSVAEVSPVFESRARGVLADAGVEGPEPSAAYDVDTVADALQTTVETAGEATAQRNDAILTAESFVDGFDATAGRHEGSTATSRRRRSDSPVVTGSATGNTGRRRTAATGSRSRWPAVPQRGWSR